jgi:hypothetical protein
MYHFDISRKNESIGKIKAQTHKFIVQTEAIVKNFFQEVDPVTSTTPNSDFHHIFVI